MDNKQNISVALHEGLQYHQFESYRTGSSKVGIMSELGRNSAPIYGVIHYELSWTSASGDGIMCKGFTSLSLQSVQSLNIKLLLISVSMWGSQAGFAGSPRAEGIRSNWKSLFLSHQGKKLWAMSLLLQGSRALTLSQSYTSAEWSSTYAKSTGKSHPCVLPNLPEGHKLYLKIAGKTQRELHTFAPQNVGISELCSHCHYKAHVFLKLLAPVPRADMPPEGGFRNENEHISICMYGSHVWRVPDEIWAILALL